MLRNVMVCFLMVKPCQWKAILELGEQILSCLPPSLNFLLVGPLSRFILGRIQKPFPD